MASTVSSLTLQEYRRQYGNQKPHYEYWYGEARPKSVPTLLHSLLQLILGQLLYQAGYLTGSELELRIDPQWQPKPDVSGLARWSTNPYPTAPIDVVIEIISPEETMAHVSQKSREYQRIGHQVIFWIDPEKRIAWQWNIEHDHAQEVTAFLLPNGNQIALKDIFQEMDRRIQEHSPPEMPSLPKSHS